MNHNVLTILICGLLSGACGRAAFESNQNTSALLATDSDRLPGPDQVQTADAMPAETVVEVEPSIIKDIVVTDIADDDLQPGKDTEAGKGVPDSGKDDDTKDPGKPPAYSCANLTTQPLNCQSQNANLFVPESSISNLNLMGEDFSQSNLVRSRIDSVNLQASCGRGSELSDSHIINTNLLQSDVSLSNLSRSEVSRVNLQQANLRGSNLSAATFSYVNLHKTCAEQSNFSDADFHSEINASYFNAARSNLSRSIVRQGSNFSYSNLESANLSAITIEDGVDFSYANFKNANLSGAQIATDVNFSNADFSGATWIDGRKCAPQSIGTCI